MTPTEGFRFGFLFRCAEEGMDPDAAEKRAAQALAIVEKRAGDEPGWLGRLAAAPGDIAKGVAHSLYWGAGLPLLAAGASTAAVGGLGGHLLAQAQEEDVDPAEVRRQELISALNYHAGQAERRRRYSAGMPAGRPG